ncbi:MAG: hypothetical protein U0821_17175 [Chloroflexota bacterium]
MHERVIDATVPHPAEATRGVVAGLVLRGLVPWRVSVERLMI